MDIIELLVNPVTILMLILVVILVIFLLTGFVIIQDDQVGIKIRKIFGKAMPQGQIIARQEGDVGIQADVLMPRLYWFNPISWRIKKSKMTEIPQGKIGIVEAIDGKELPHGRLLGDHVECNSYQDAKSFLDGGGYRGPQVEILRPGIYRINTELFSVASVENTEIKKEEIGMVVALDGETLPSGFIVAPKPDESKVSHKFFQDGQMFINDKGYRGPQLDTLQPGEYYINPMQFDVIHQEQTEVPPGYVGVLRSNIGKELAKDEEKPKIVPKKVDFDQPIHEDEEVVLTTDKNQRGIWKEPVAPGKYNVNTLAFTVYLVPTSAVMIDWASGAEIRAEHMVDGEKRTGVTDEDKAHEFFKFSQLRVTSKDGFQLDVDVRMVIRIRPQHASFVIARFGSVANLIEQIVHPLIDSSFRNKAGEKKAIDFIMSRTSLQKEALERAKEEFDKYHVEAQNLLIAYIKVDEKLLATQTEKEIAVQQQTQYEQQAIAQEKRISVKEKEARAEKQKDVIDAKLSVDISKDKAQAMRMEAEGIRDSTKYKADGEAYQSIEVGEGIAKAYEAQALVIGPQILGLLKTFEKISDGQIKIVPDVLVTGDSKDGGNNLISALLAMLVNEGALKLQPKPTTTRTHPKPVEKKGTPLPSLPVETETIDSSFMEGNKLSTEKVIEEFKYLADEPETETQIEEPKTTRTQRTTPKRTTSIRSKRSS